MLDDALDTIPVFPLPQVVLFPHAVLPLHVFEPRYRQMLQDCLSSHEALAIAQLVPGEDRFGRPKIARIGGGGLVVKAEKLADGRSNIIVLGQARLVLEELDPDDRPYRRAKATILHDEGKSISDNQRTALLAAASMFANEVRKHDPTFVFRLPPDVDAAHLADICAHQLVVDASARQEILELLDSRARAELVLHKLAVQHGAMMQMSEGDLLN